MTTIKTFLDIIAELWPHATDEEKDKFCAALLTSKAKNILEAFYTLKNSIIKRRLV